MKKTFNEWEKDKGAFAIDETKYDLNQQLTEEEFLQLHAEGEGNFRGVSYDDRVKFLEDNDYPVTRENLLDPNLSVKPKP